jgi:hypothetical protein
MTYDQVKPGMIVQVHLNTPYAQLLGKNAGEPSEERDGPRDTGFVLPGEAQNYRHVPPTIKTALRGVGSKYPAVMIVELMAARNPPLKYGQVKLGPSGSCLDYLCFRTCEDARCFFKHDGGHMPSSRPQERKW